MTDTEELMELVARANALVARVKETVNMTKKLIRIENGEHTQLMHDLRDVLIAARVPLIVYQRKLFSAYELASSGGQYVPGERMKAAKLASILDDLVEFEERGDNGEWVPGKLSKGELRMFIVMAGGNGWFPEEWTEPVRGQVIPLPKSSVGRTKSSAKRRHNG